MPNTPDNSIMLEPMDFELTTPNSGENHGGSSAGSEEGETVEVDKARAAGDSGEEEENRLRSTLLEKHLVKQRLRTVEMGSDESGNGSQSQQRVVVTFGDGAEKLDRSTKTKKDEKEGSSESDDSLTKEHKESTTIIDALAIEKPFRDLSKTPEKTRYKDEHKGEKKRNEEKNKKQSKEKSSRADERSEKHHHSRTSSSTHHSRSATTTYRSSHHYEPSYSKSHTRDKEKYHREYEDEYEHRRRDRRDERDRDQKYRHPEERRYDTDRKEKEVKSKSTSSSEAGRRPIISKDYVEGEKRRSVKDSHSYQKQRNPDAAKIEMPSSPSASGAESSEEGSSSTNTSTSTSEDVKGGRRKKSSSTTSSSSSSSGSPSEDERSKSRRHRKKNKKEKEKQKHQHKKKHTSVILEMEQATTTITEITITTAEPDDGGDNEDQDNEIDLQPSKRPRYSKFEDSEEDDDDYDGPRTQKTMKKIEEYDETLLFGASPISRSKASPRRMGIFGQSPEGLEEQEDEMLDDEDNLLEQKDYEDLTEEEKAVLPPELLAAKERAWQRRLIAQLPIYYPGISGCRSVNEYNCDFKISEGAYGVVYRGTEKKTDDVVALKRLKMEKEKQGFPITALREINMLLKCGQHPNVVNVREVVVGTNMDKIYLVMDYVEHDIKALMDMMKKRGKKFTIPQVKTLMLHLLNGIKFMHEEYVVHRDLKTSNLLLSNKGILKIGDFGLAREFGNPLKPYTPVVVTLWYRAPELLLGIKLYSTPIDMWSIGCIFGEFLKLEPIFPGKGEIQQMTLIFKEVGTPNENIWPGCSELPGMKQGVFADLPFNQLRKKFAQELSDNAGFSLLNQLLALCPERRLTAEEALKSPWFKEDPQPAPPASFPTWPTRNAGVIASGQKKPLPSAEVIAARVAAVTGQPMLGKGKGNVKLSNEVLQTASDLKVDPRKVVASSGFSLKFDAPKFGGGK